MELIVFVSTAPAAPEAEVLVTAYRLVAAVAGLEEEEGEESMAGLRGRTWSV